MGGKEKSRCGFVSGNGVTRGHWGFTYAFLVERPQEVRFTFPERRRREELFFNFQLDCINHKWE